MTGVTMPLFFYYPASVSCDKNTIEDFVQKVLGLRVVSKIISCL